MYCASKGFDSTGMSACDAIKAQLQHENNGIHHPRITSKTHVSIEEVYVADIRISNPQHYQRVDARQLDSNNDSPLIAGVLFKQGNLYVIIDGYHRMKWLREKGIDKATYVILTNRL